MIIDLYEEMKSRMSTIKLINASCADQNVDAVVNAANDGLWAGGGICGVIFKKAGMQEFMTRSKMVKGLPFEATLTETTITRAEATNAFYELRKQAADVPEMSLDEINAEISAVRAERKR